LHQNVLRDAIQCLSDLAAIRSNLKAGRLVEPLREPFRRLRTNELDLVRADRGQPEDISASLGIAGGSEPVEGRFEDLAWHPDMLGDVAQSGLSCRLPEPKNL
jgi:hypothetical protein